MASTTTPNMFLVVPGVGTQDGPDYGLNINSDLGLIDLHDHSLGKGVAISPAGLNINSDLTFNSNDLTNVGGIGFTALGSNPSTLQFLYVSPGVETPLTEDLWFNDGNGNQVQITSGGTVNATIASLPGESYAAGTFFWVQGVGSTTPANFDIGSITLRPNVAATTFGVVLSPPSGIGSQYNINLPLLPVSKLPLSIDNSGVMTAGQITTTDIATATILGSNIASTTITGANIANNTIGLTQLDTTVLQWNTQTFTIPSYLSIFTVRCATTANITLSGLQTIDGISVIANDKVLVKNQTTSSQDGVYVVAAGSWTRSVSYNTAAQLSRTQIGVSSGTINFQSVWSQNNVLTTLSDPQSWSRSSIQTFTVPANVNELIIQGCGGGGGGGGGLGADAAGGGGGSTPFTNRIPVTGGDILTITLGAGGLGGTGNLTGASGGTGVDSTVIAGSTILLYKGATGGIGAGVSSGVPHAGGLTYPTPVYTTGSQVTSGSTSTLGSIGVSATATLYAGVPALGGQIVGGNNGGAGGSGFGPGAQGQDYQTSTPPAQAANATNPGSGGAGAAAKTGATAGCSAGGNGAGGQVIIQWLGHS